MSTRIHNGTRCSGTLRPDILARRLADIVTPIHEQLVIEAVAVLAYANVRHALAGITPEAIGDIAFLVQADKVIAEASKSAQRSTGQFSLEMSVAFVSDPADDRYVYAGVFAQNNRLSEAWSQLPGVEAFPYWDNTDGPDDVTEADWTERGQIWNRVLGFEPWTKAGVCWEADIPSAAVLFITDPGEFLRRVGLHMHRLELQRRRQLVRRRDPRHMDLLASIIANTLGSQFTTADLAADWEREEAAERARFQ